MTDRTDLSWNQDDIERHLKSAMEALTPNVLDKIDLTTPQELYVGPSRTVKLYRRLRTAGLAAAACLCAVVLSSGIAAYQNSRVESIIGIDVNPSIELSVNRKEKVLKAEPLNEDAKVILDDMDLENVDLDIAVNALIGSMVRNGYLTELDNAILVTVANDDTKKASVLRQDVVIDIEESLEAHQVQAVVYDQQASEDDAIRELAGTYGISYGKAYFLQELVLENDLTKEDMEAFAGMTMEEIAREIADRSYTVRQKSEEGDGTGKEPSAVQESSFGEETVGTSAGRPEEGSDSESASMESEESSDLEASKTGESESGTASSGAAGGESAQSGKDETEESAEDGGKKTKIDYVDYEDGHLDVIFKEKVKWKNPTVSVKDANGQSYSAMIADTDSESCEIVIHGLPGGTECSFILAGVSVREGRSYGSIKGYFETPEIAEEAEPENSEEEEEQELPRETVREPEETTAPESRSEEETPEETEKTEMAE